MPEGLGEQAAGPCWTLRPLARRRPKIGQVGRARRSCGRGEDARSTGCRSSSAGRRTAGRSSRCRWSSRRPRRPASATSACIACRSTTAHHRHALAPAQGRRGPLPRGREQARSECEVAVAIGGDPAMIYAATAPLPPDFDEFLFAGFLREQAVELVSARPLTWRCPPTPRSCSRATSIRRAAARGPVWRPHRLLFAWPTTTRCSTSPASPTGENPIYPTTIVGRPPMEDDYLGKATERFFLPLIQMMLPEIVDMNMPVEGVFHNLAIVSIQKSYPGQARKVMYGLWGLGQMMFTKTIIVVDDDVDVQDLSEVAWRVANNIDPRRDIDVLRWARSTRSTMPRRCRSSAASWASTPRERARRWPPPPLARRHRDERRDQGAGGREVAELRDLRHALGHREGFARRHQVRAQHLRAALRLPRHDPGRAAACRRSRQFVWITVAMVARADAGDVGEPPDRPRDRRAQPAHRRRALPTGRLTPAPVLRGVRRLASRCSSSRRRSSTRSASRSRRSRR